METPNEFANALSRLMDEWDRCMNIQQAKGHSKETAAQIVGEQATAWLSTKKGNTNGNNTNTY